ncbi:MAG: hypothetical protein V4714_20505 [Bacteroidota bacterium]
MVNVVVIIVAQRIGLPSAVNNCFYEAPQRRGVSGAILWGNPCQTDVSGSFLSANVA